MLIIAGSNTRIEKKIQVKMITEMIKWFDESGQNEKQIFINLRNIY